MSTPTEQSPLLAKLTDQADEHIENADTAQSSTVGRKIGWSSAYILVISRVIGSGIWSMPGIIVSEVGPGPALCLWIFGALVAWAGLAITIEYAAMLPRSGGIKVYLEYTYPRPKYLVSIIVAVHYIILGVNATNCVVFAKYMLFAAGKAPTDISTKTLAVGLLTAITVVHGCFYRTGVVIQNILGWVKIVLTVFVILTGFYVCTTQQTSQLTWTNMWDGGSTDWSSLSTAFFKVVTAYSGLDNITNVMDEVKNPVRTVNTAATAALWTASSMYVLLNIAFIMTVPLADINKNRELLAALFFERLGLGKVFLPITIALGAAGSVMVSTFGLARLKQEIARDGILPLGEALASNKPFGAPFGALILHYIPTMLFIVGPPSGKVLAFAGEIEGYTKQFFGLAIAVGLVILRYKKPELKRPYHAWMPSVWLTVLFSVLLTLTPIFPYIKGHPEKSHNLYAIVSIAVFLFGALYWYVWTVALPRLGKYKLEEEPQRLSDGSWITRLVRRPVTNMEQ